MQTQKGAHIHTIILLCALFIIQSMRAQTSSSSVPTSNDPTVLLNYIIEKLPCDAPTSIYQQDLPITITQSGYYCIAEDLTGTGPFLITINAPNVELNLSGHTLDLSNTGLVGIEINNSTNVRIINGIIKSSTSSGIHIGNSSQKVTLDNVTLLQCATGIQAEDSNTIVIKNSLCQGGLVGVECSATSTNCYDFVISKSSILANSTAGIMLTGSEQTILSEVKIRDCHIVNPTQNANATNPTYGIQAYQTRGLYIDTVTIDITTLGLSITNSCDIRCKNSKILNTALNGIQTSVTNGSSLQNSMQTYSFENVIVDTCGGTSISCSNTNRLALKECHLLNAQQNALYVSGCTTISVDKCTLANASGATILQIGDGINFVDTMRVTDCLIQNNLPMPNLNGIHITQAMNVAIERCTISTAGVSNSTTGSGILVDGTVFNCLLSHCMITNSSSNGICFANATTQGTNLTIDHSHIFGSATNGIFITGANNCSVRSCEIAFCPTGINLVNAQNVAILNNVISSCFTSGITVDNACAGCGIRDNTFYNITDPTGQQAAVTLNNQANGESKIYHNFAYVCDSYYQDVPLCVSPAAQIGTLENIQCL